MDNEVVDDHIEFNNFEGLDEDMDMNLESSEVNNEGLNNNQNLEVNNEGLNNNQSLEVNNEDINEDIFNENIYLLLSDIEKQEKLEIINQSLLYHVHGNILPRERLFRATQKEPNRWSILAAAEPYLKIFPWFNLPKKRTRETLNPDRGKSIDAVYDSLCYMWRTYEPHEIDFLRNLYLKMSFEKLKCLSAIVDVKSKFEIYRNTIIQQSLSSLSSLSSVSSLPPGPTVSYDFESKSNSYTDIDTISLQPSTESDYILDPSINQKLDDHEARIKKLEDPNESGGKRRRGGDRARWMRIRDEDLPTRANWCVPGSVFGFYADGIGPLVPIDMRKREGIVVYSTDPDTVEEHPDPQHEDHYALIVLVGEAPVALRIDQYSKLQHLKCNVNIYANNEGEICVRELHKGDPTGGIIFATTDWSDNYATDEQGFPIFQGVRGVCANIISYQNQRTSTRFETAVTQITRHVSEMIIGSPKSKSPNIAKSPRLIGLQQQKDKIKNELVELENLHEIFNECKELKKSLQELLVVHEKLLGDYRHFQLRIPKSKPIYGSLESVVADQLIASITQKNHLIQLQMNELNGLSSVNKVTYNERKEKLERDLDTIKSKIKKEKS